jgi:hypothetical protein
MAQPLIKSDIKYDPVEIGSVVPDEWLKDAQWTQKTAPTKIFTALPGEHIALGGKES